VWGSKKLKAIAIRGSKGVSIAQPKELIGLSKQLHARFKKDPMYAAHIKYGTNYWVGDTVMRAMRLSMPNLTADALQGLYEKNLACAGCFLHCSHYYKITSGKYKGTAGEGFEGNTQIVGAGLQVNDGAFVCNYNNLCNQLGLDTMHPGVAIVWAILLYQTGIITKKDTEGIELTWGAGDAFLKMTRKIAYKEGFGEILDAYPLGASKKVGRESELYASHCKGYPGSGPGFMSSVKTTLAHAVSIRGHDHLIGSPGIEAPNRHPEMTNEILERVGLERYNDSEIFTDSSWSPSYKKAIRVYDCENLFSISDMTGTCKFAAQEVLFVEGIGMSDYSKLLGVVTGVDFSVEDLVKAARREFLLERAYNAREGVRKIDDYPHAFWWQLKYGNPHPKYNYDKFPMSFEDYTLLLEEYYKLRGCDKETGIPTRSNLEKAGLKDVAADLERRGILNKS
jgi:aldehyde:ferredoxin oxidoreductase